MLINKLSYESIGTTIISTDDWEIVITQTGALWASEMFTYVLTLLKGSWPKENQLKWLICNQDILKLKQEVKEHDSKCQPASFWIKQVRPSSIEVIMKV